VEVWCIRPVDAAKEPLSTFIEPPPSQSLNPESTIEEAVAILKDSGLKFVVVLDNQKQLYGVLNAADAVGAVEVFAFLRGSSRRDVRKVQMREVVSREMVTISAEESSLAAASTMHERKLGWIPVVDSMSGRHLKGFVQLEKINYWLVQELGHKMFELS
jgi:CBS-domain-containing membrane protein